MTVHLAAIGGSLRLTLTGWDAVWAFRRRLTVPLDGVRDVAAVSRPDADADRPPFRAPGTSWPGRIVAGTYHGLGAAPQFWCVRRGPVVVAIDLTGTDATAGISRLVLEVADPDATVAALDAAR